MKFSVCLSVSEAQLQMLILKIVLGAMSKALATIATQPLIVAKVGLQSRPPPARQGKKFKTFLEVMEYIIEHEGPMGLFKGITPQIVKGILVQGLLMMTKERMELLFVVLFAYLRQVRAKQLQKAADLAKSGAEAVADKAKTVLPVAGKRGILGLASLFVLTYLRCVGGISILVTFCVRLPVQCLPAYMCWLFSKAPL